MLGQKMMEKQLNGNGSHEIGTLLAPGIYVLSIYSQSGVRSQKIYISN